MFVGAVTSQTSNRATDAAHSQVLISQLCITTRVINNACYTILRAYQKYKLQKTITELQANHQWLFDWSSHCNPFNISWISINNAQLITKINVLTKSLLGINGPSSCHTKMLLIAYMLSKNQCIIRTTGAAGAAAQDVGRTTTHFPRGCDKMQLSSWISNLGEAFVLVCKSPNCVTARLKFFTSYWEYYDGFCDLKNRDVQKTISKLLSTMANSISLWKIINKNANKSIANSFKSRRVLNSMHHEIKQQLDKLTSLVGSNTKAKQLLKFEIAAKRAFLLKLSNYCVNSNSDLCDYMESCFLSPDLNCGSNKITRDNKIKQFRSVGLQLQLSFSFEEFESVRVNSREVKYDHGKYSLNSVMNNQHHVYLNSIKQLIRDNYYKKQNWVPHFINHSRAILGMMMPLEVDQECVQQQCLMNCYNSTRMIRHVFSQMRKCCNTKETNLLLDRLETEDARIKKETDNAIINVQIRCGCIGCTKNEPRFSFLSSSDDRYSPKFLYDMLDALDHIRADFMDKYFKTHMCQLITSSKRFESKLFVADLYSNRIGLKNTIQWASNCNVKSHPESLAIFQLADLNVDELSRMEKLMTLFGSFMANTPSSNYLDSCPEIFSLLRISILRTMIQIQDLVAGFTILQYAGSVSHDRSMVDRFKKSIDRVLQKDAQQSPNEIVKNILSVIFTERPCLNDNERRLLGSLVNQVIRKPASNKVCQLALLRVKAAVIHQLFKNPIPPTCNLDRYSEELHSISEQTERIWKLSVETYGPIYDTLIHHDRIWDICDKNNRNNNADEEEVIENFA